MGVVKIIYWIINSFYTNSSIIKVKWEILNDLKMDHMPETGIKGVDLDFRNKDKWQYLIQDDPKEN